MTRFPLINAVLEGGQEGEIYSFDSFEGRFIIHKAGFSYLDLKTKPSYEDILSFFNDTKQLPVYFHIYNPTDQFVHCIKKDKRFNYKYRERIQLEYDLDFEASDGKPDLNHRFRLEPINYSNFECLTSLNLNIAQHFWKSKHDFLENGFGSVVLSSEDVGVAICYSSCIAGGYTEIDIATHENFRGKGYAKITGNAFIKQAQRNGVKPNWDCFKDNHASLRTAIKLGFKPVNEYYFLSIYAKARA
uniref:GNAT family N-acetyltransferase n=1 Tax=Roseihalotalea indica TaxID=2867963 RepID=A0AA49GNC7_9BACT|nr:GNAT family N-acetyltransferase [Tunicatimonas sp. TK19036]